MSSQHSVSGCSFTWYSMHSGEVTPGGHDKRFEPVVLSIEWTLELYRKVTLSVRPGRRWSCIVGPVGATDEQAKQAALELVAHINP
jgi:hypothetical protein